MDNSLEVLGKTDRIAVQVGKFIQLMRTAINEYHGFIIEEWHILDEAAQKALRRNGYNFNPKTGKLKL